MQGYEKFDAQERALELFRKFASQHNVHMSIVIHPRSGVAVAKHASDTSHGDTMSALTAKRLMARRCP